jgi:hypothetical protein
MIPTCTIWYMEWILPAAHSSWNESYLQHVVHGMNPTCSTWYMEWILAAERGTWNESHLQHVVHMEWILPAARGSWNESYLQHVVHMEWILPAARGTWNVARLIVSPVGPAWAMPWRIRLTSPLTSSGNSSLQCQCRNKFLQSKKEKNRQWNLHLIK